MSRDYVPNTKQQVDLLKLRSNARQAETQRRSQVNQTVDTAQHVAQEQAKAQRKKELAENGDRWIHNSEETIVRLVKQSAAFNRAIVRMAEAWAPTGQDPIETANAIVEEMVNDLDNDQHFTHQAKVWAKAQIKNGVTVTKPQVKRPKP
jgi:hypothetical protein